MYCFSFNFFTSSSSCVEKKCVLCFNFFAKRQFVRVGKAGPGKGSSSLWTACHEDPNQAAAEVLVTGDSGVRKAWASAPLLGPRRCLSPWGGLSIAQHTSPRPTAFTARPTRLGPTGPAESRSTAPPPLMQAAVTGQALRTVSLWAFYECWLSE